MSHGLGPACAVGAPTDTTPGPSREINYTCKPVVSSLFIPLTATSDENVLYWAIGSCTWCAGYALVAFPRPLKTQPNTLVFSTPQFP